jgi:hypothetical protein
MKDGYLTDNLTSDFQESRNKRINMEKIKNDLDQHMKSRYCRNKKVFMTSIDSINQQIDT